MNLEKLTWIAIVLVLVYAIYKERQALGCKCIPDGSDCDNVNGKAVAGTEPGETDTEDMLHHRIRKASKFMDRWVIWRMALIISFICTLLISIMVSNQFPDTKTLIISMFVITCMVYASLNFYKFHLISHIEQNIDKCLHKLKKS